MALWGPKRSSLASPGPLSQDLTLGQLSGRRFLSTAGQGNQPEQPKAIQSPELLMATEATL